MADLAVRLKYKKSDADDWTKVEDKALRKKLQNRLAKRKSRTEPTKSSRNEKGKAQRMPEPLNDVQQIPENKNPESNGKNAPLTETWSDSQALSSLSQTLRESRQGLDSIDEQVIAFFSTPGLSEHRFICLTQYSLIRALVQNANVIALDPTTLADEEALSPWTTTNPYPIAAPHDLIPTSIQLCTPHHPYLDVVAPPLLRDNLLLFLVDDALEDQLCYELHLNSFSVWGSQPWNRLAWEVNQTFATNWAYLLNEEIIRTSNFWRGERGEGPLVLPDFGGAYLDDVQGNVLGEIF